MKPSDGDSHLEDIFASYVDRLNAGEELDPEKVIAENPTLGADIVEYLEGYVGFNSAPPSNQQEPLGTLGDYTLRRQIGRGGMGVVYEAWENSMDRRVALKVLPAGVAADPRACARFLREAQTAGKLSHPNVVPVFFTGVKEQTPFYAMEFVEGETLAQVLNKLKAAQPEADTPFGKKDDSRSFLNLAEAFADVADGLQHAHSKGIIHRDVKPSNLILDAEGRLRILDFGLARLEGQESLTATGDFLGTPLYMSPEQARRKKIPVDHRTDVYSLGATLYEMLTLGPPFSGKDHQDTLSQIIERDAVEPRKVNLLVPKDLETIVLKCLRKEATDRYGTAEALAQDLRRFVRGDAIEAKAQARWERVWRRMLRHRRRIAIALVLALFAAAALGFTVRWREDRRLRDVAEYETKVGRAVLQLELASLTEKSNAGESGITGPPDARTPFPSLLNSDPVESAHRGLAQAEAILPALPDAHYHRARAFLYQGNQMAALESLEAASPPESPFIPALILRAGVLERRGEPARGREILGAAAQAARAPWERAWLEIANGWSTRDFNGVIAAYGKLINLASPREPFAGCAIAARLGRGAARVAAQDYSQALRDYVVAGSLVPGAVEPAILEAKAWLLMGRKDDGESRLLELFESTTRRDEVAVAIVALYAGLKDTDKQFEWIGRIGIPSVEAERRADLYFKLGRWDEAKDAAQRAIEIDPRNAEAYFTLWFIYEGEGHQEESRRILETGLQHRPDSWGILHMLGNSCRSTGRLRQAIQYYERASKVAANPTIDISYVANCYLELGAEARAYDLFRKAREANPMDKGVYNNWAIALVNAGRLDEAATVFQQCIDADPNWSWAHGNLGRVFLSQGKLDQAIEACHRAQDLLPWSQAACEGAALAYELQGKSAEALAEYLKILAKKPGEAEAHAGIARLLRNARGKIPQEAIQEATTAIEKASAKAPRSPIALSTLALALNESMENGSRLRALDAVLRGCDLAEESGRSIGEIRRTLREVFRGLGDGDSCRLVLLPHLPPCAALDDLVAALEEGVEVSRCGELDLERWSEKDAAVTSVRRRYLLALLREREGRRAEALEIFRGLAAEADAKPEPILSLARVLRAQGNATGAEHLLRSAIEKRPAQTRSLWDLWLEVQLDDRKLSAQTVLADLPLAAEGVDAGGYAGDVAWLLEQLRDKNSLRFNCGGEEIATPDGRIWGRDRFFLSGQELQWEDIRIGGTGAEAIYLRLRGFSAGEDESLWGYRIPLPMGKYRVCLHFAEVQSNLRDWRCFDVLCQERQVLSDINPVEQAGFRVAVVKEFQVEMIGGPLSIRFLYRSGQRAPAVSGIEIEKLD